MFNHLVIAQLVTLLARQIHHARPGPAAGESNIGHQRLARAIDHTADNRQAHRGLDVFQPLFQRLDGADHIKPLPGTGRAGNDVDAAVAQAEGFEDLKANLDLFHRVRTQRYPDRIADPGPQQ